ncbi:MAG: hypothetical protein EA370_17095 [Wenzhouxiangella sp.]|nr:MAG: hypothetical protein EA370_17095 [Wenzhouxiangella sp.]
MNDFTLRPAPRSRLRLLEDDLQISDETLAAFHATQSWLSSRAIVNQWLNPNWSSAEDEIARMLRSVPAQPAAANRPNRPEQPLRAASVSDLLRAVSQLPEVQALMLQANRGARRQFRLFEREWNNATFLHRAIMVTMATIVGGSAMGIILGHSETRGPALRAINLAGPIGIPGAPGTSIRISPDGVEAAYELPLPVPGVSVEGEIGRSELPGRNVDWQVMVNVDIAAILRFRNIHF